MHGAKLHTKSRRLAPERCVRPYRLFDEGLPPTRDNSHVQLSDRNTLRQEELRGAVTGGTFKRPSRATPVIRFYSSTPTANSVTPKAIPNQTSTKTPLELTTYQEERWHGWCVYASVVPR